MGAGTVGRHDAQEPAMAFVVFVAKFEVADDELVGERRVFGESAHPLVCDARLGDGRGADDDVGPGGG